MIKEDINNKQQIRKKLPSNNRTNLSITKKIRINIGGRRLCLSVSIEGIIDQISNKVTIVNRRVQIIYCIHN